MNSPKVVCPECRFEFGEDEALTLPGGRGCPRCKGKAFLDAIPAEKASEAKREKGRLLCEGSIFDKYRIISFLGAGGMGEVYKAEHLLLKQFFALKVMKDGDSLDENALSKRFLREAKCFHLLDHPNIVRVFDIGCDRASQLLYISMEYLQGENLAEVKEQLPEDEILKIAFDIGKALQELEKKRMVHRDIKPSNIIRSSDGNCKLMDLGIAKSRSESGVDNTLTLEQCLIGTPAYASPEQCRSSHEVDIRSDIYSLGVTLYQLASGRLPFQGATPVETILEVINKQPIPLRKLAPGLSGNAVELIECMMEKAPEKRPQNAQLLCCMIDSVRQGRSSGCCRRSSRRTKILAAVTLMLLASGTAVGVCAEHLIDEDVETGGVKTAVSELSGSGKKTEERNEQSFLQSKFISASHNRTLRVRLEEIRKIVAYLESPDSSGVSFRKERLKFFTGVKQKLELQLKRKELRRKRRDRVPVDPALKAEIENFLKRKEPPFCQTRKGMVLVRKIVTALREEKIDPDTLFSDGSNAGRSLTGLALCGMLPLQEHLLKNLIFSGADIDAGHGPEIPLPRSGRIGRQRMRLAGIMTVNGADNVDLQDGGPMILGLLDIHAGHPIVCRPSPNHIDWFLVSTLVESGARLDCRDSMGRTLVHWAAVYDKGELLNKLLLAGAPALKDDRDVNGETPFQLAIRNHASSAVSVLERFGLNTPVTEADKAQGALIYGIINDEPLQAEQALDAGASLKYLYANKLNVLQNAVVYGRNALVKFLLERGASFESGPGKISLPCVAICAGSPDLFRKFIEKQPPENMTVKHGNAKYWLPGSVIIHHRKNPALAERFFDVMLACKWEIDRPGPRGLNLLEQALIIKDTPEDLIRLLLKKGADPALFLKRKKIDLKTLPFRIRRLIARDVKK